jgi:uncharacterized protein involved in exopolysaccharide biosynthesis
MSELAHNQSLDFPKMRPLPTARDLASAVFRQKKTVLWIALLIVSAGSFYIATYPRYESEVVFLLERDRVDPLVTPEQTSNPQLLHESITEEQVNSEAALMKSQDLLREVVLGSGLTQKPGAWMPQREDVRVAEAVRRLSTQLHVTAIHKTNIITASYSSNDPAQAKRVMDLVTELYLAKHAEVHRPGAQVQFFEHQADKFRQGWDAANQRLADFTAKTQVVSAPLERDGTLQQRIAFSQILASSEADIQRLEQRISYLEKQLEPMHPRMVTQERKSDNGVLLGQLKSTLLAQQLRRTQLLEIYQPNHRLVKDVDEEIAQTERDIANELSAPIAEQTTDQDPGYEMVREDLLKTKTELAATRAQADAMKVVVAQYQGEAEQLNLRGLQQATIQNDAKLQESNYLLYAQKTEEARITAALDAGHIVNAVVAQPPQSPTLPRHSAISLALLTLVSATVFGIGFGFVRDLTDPTFQHPDQIESYVGVPVIASIPGPQKIVEAKHLERRRA